MIIDCHGHYTTAPKALEEWRNRQIAGLKDPAVAPKAVRARDQRRRAAREHRDQPARQDEGARQRPHDLLAARELHGAPHRRLPDQRDLGGDLQRALLPREPALPRPLHRRGDAAAVAGRRSEDLHSRAGEVRQRVRLRRHQPQSRSVGRPLEGAAAVRPALVPDLREDGRVRHPGDDPRQHQLQRLLPHHRRALPERRHHGVHAVPDGRPVQGLPDAEVRDPARRRRGALPLGPLPRAGAGAEEAAAEGPPAEQHLSSTPASTTSRASTC